MTIKQVHEAVILQETTHLFMGKDVREVFSDVSVSFFVDHGGWHGVVLSAGAAIRFHDL